MSAALALGVPSAALACSGGPSAVNVYKECLATGGGSKPTAPPTTAPQGSASTSTPVSSEAESTFKKAGKDRKLLSTLVTSNGASRLAPEDDSQGGTAPSALGSAFDLGSGPTALLIVLAATALLLLGGNGWRVWRSRHRA